jgi:casein kinase I family protein HRR25
MINNKYEIIDQIGKGSFGKIYKARNIRTNEHVAIKIESIKSEYKLLKNETKIYNYLINTEGIPVIKWFGKDTENYYMVLNLLGESLETIKKNGFIFSLENIRYIGIKIIQLIENIHKKGLVHRDIKPDNFLIGLEKNQIYIIDFGFCKSYLRENIHIPMKKTHNLIGSFNYCSLNAHNNMELSRRDDLESIGYILYYFYYGSLSWQKKDGKTNEEKIKLKEQIINNNIFANYFKYVRELEFNEKPNYQYLIEFLYELG